MAQRRNKQSLEKVLELARQRLNASLGDDAEETAYFQGVTDALSHALGIAERFKIEKKQTVTVEERLAIVRGE